MKQQKKVWIPATRSSRDAALIGQAVADLDAQVKGARDAKRELDAVVKEATPPKPPAPKEPEGPAKTGRHEVEVRLASGSLDFDVEALIKRKWKKASPVPYLVGLLLCAWLAWFVNTDPYDVIRPIEAFGGTDQYARTVESYARLRENSKIISILTACLSVLLFYMLSLTMAEDEKTKVVETYRFGRLETMWPSDKDGRADGISMGKLRHMDPMIVPVKFRVLSRDGNWEKGTRRVSLELLSQVLHHKNIKASLDAETVFEKMQFTAVALNSVNLDRYDPLFSKESISCNTMEVAHALYRKMAFDARLLGNARKGWVAP